MELRLHIEDIFEIFEAYEYFTTDEIREAICNVIGLTATWRKINYENTEAK